MKKQNRKQNQKQEKKQQENIRQEQQTLDNQSENKNDLTQQIQDEKDKYIRLYAEFENYRKRTAKEKLEMFETAAENVIKNLLPVLDDFERAMAEMKKNNENELLKGVELIYDKFKKTLEKEGLKPIEVKKAEDFDPEIHEAIAQIPVQEEDMKNKIVDVVEKGYRLGNKVIRFPKVVTGR